MKKQSKKEHGFANISGTVVVALVAVCLVLGGVLWAEKQNYKALNGKYEESRDQLTKANEEIKGLVEDNRTLNERAELKQKMLNEQQKLAVEHKERADKLDKAASELRSRLPKVVFRKPTDQLDTEQETRSNKRIQVLWEAYCLDGFQKEDCPKLNQDN